eukprot:TRINITY_DN48163_c0_g1_i1.p1 TRINITY_DN48163_c0_g1~~TRINITY_DN48163_c0_g1_i1.p1  ORF type:complete len:373 (-),score=70.65 TRINITY_DN48163_c0_g1_i1:68-1186(-)
MEKYRRLRVLGKGHCSKVFLVHDSITGKLAVVKQIEAPLSSQERERALCEAALLRVLSHPNIIGYYEAFLTKSGFICTIMEYAQGGDLHGYLQKHALRCTNVPEAKVWAWLRQLCEALRYLHDHNVIHRDIKARNIFLRQTGEVQLGDFGISTVLDTSNESVVSAIGTPCYASPERMRRLPYGPSADIWSLGVVVYEMCALRRPFDKANLSALVDTIVRGEYHRLDERLVSVELRNVVDSMLVVNPDERPSAGELCESLSGHHVLEYAHSKMEVVELMPCPPSSRPTLDALKLADPEEPLQFLDVDDRNDGLQVPQSPKAAWSTSHSSMSSSDRGAAEAQRAGLGQVLFDGARRLLGIGQGSARYQLKPGSS